MCASYLERRGSIKKFVGCHVIARTVQVRKMTDVYFDEEMLNWLIFCLQDYCLV